MAAEDQSLPQQIVQTLCCENRWEWDRVNKIHERGRAHCVQRGVSCDQKKSFSWCERVGWAGILADEGGFSSGLFTALASR